MNKLKYILTGLIGLIGTAGFAALSFTTGALIGPLIGSFAGAVFGYVFEDTANALIAALGMPVQFWQLGALAGFFTTFVRRR